MRAFVLLVAFPSLAAAQAFTPAPAASVRGYWPDVMPCKIVRDDRARIECKGDLLEGKTLRELSILRNTIYARYGWDGYRKAWLRDYMHAQPWFKPNPRFSYKQLSDADRKNAHFIATREQSFTDVELGVLRDDVLARHGKIWNDKPSWTVGGREVHACKRPKGAVEAEGDVDVEGSRDCRYLAKRWYEPNPAYTDKILTAEDKVELGLIDRASGSFALDDDKRGKSEAGLDRVLALAELRQLSLRDLRLLRNTIYARRGRPFKSQILHDHFAGMSWYHVDAGYSDKLLTANDQRNVALIKSVEDELGGPLDDEDWLTEPATDGA